MTTKVAVYGTLRKGHGNSGLLSNADLLGTFRTKNKYYMYNLGYYPCVVEALDGHGYSIEVEIYTINDSELRSLDRLEGYPHLYDKVDLEVNGIDCFMYVMNKTESHWEEISSGNWNDVS